MTKRNFLLDIGNVLLRFSTRDDIGNLFPSDPALCDVLYQLIFKSHEWIELDRGTLTHAEAFARFTARRPDLSAQIQRVRSCLPLMLAPIEPTSALLPRIKRAGHGLYFLSNYHAELAKDALARNPFFALFDGGVFSCDVHLIKPDPAIYQHLLAHYHLDPSSCLFFDDMPENVDAAIALGIPAVQFTDAQDIIRYI